MEKLNYDSLYKFLVSIGLALIALPFIGVGFIYGIEPTLISQEDYETLSQYSKNQLILKDNIRLFFESNIKIVNRVILIMIIIGILVLVTGIVLWIKAHILNYKMSQEELEGKVLSNEQTKNLLHKMSEEDIKDSTTEEVEKELNALPISDANLEQSKPDSNNLSHEGEEQREERKRKTKDVVNKYIQIEQACFRKIKSKLGDEYDCMSNVRLTTTGRYYEIDVVAVSKTDKPDRVYEIKYFENFQSSIQRIPSVVLQSIVVRDAYEKTTKRKAEVFIIIVSKTKIGDEEHGKIYRSIPDQIQDEVNISYLSVDELDIES